MRNIHVSYFHFKTSPSKLVEELVKRGQKARLVYYNGDQLVKTDNDDILFNWGYAGRVWKTHKCADVNNRNIIENKRDQKARLAANGVSTTKMFPVAGKYPGVPCVLRNSVSHHGGAGALFVDSKEKWDANIAEYQNGYCMEFIDKKREFRVHATRLGVLYVTERHPKNPNLLIWNWTNESVCGDKEVLPALEKLGLAAIKAIGYDFGGVDVMMDSDGKAYATEVNSAPALETTHSVSKYADYFEKESK